MTAEPDGEHADFIPAILQKIQDVRELIGSRAVEIEVDGGIQPDHAGLVVAAGATILVAGRAVWGAGSVEEGVSALRKAAS